MRTPCSALCLSLHYVTNKSLMCLGSGNTMVTCYRQGTFHYQCFLKHKSPYNSTLLWYHNGYGLSAASQLNSVVKEKKMSNVQLYTDKEAIPLISEMPASHVERSHLHFKCFVQCSYSETSRECSMTEQKTYRLKLDSH